MYDFYSDYKMMQEYASHSKTGLEIVAPNYVNLTVVNNDHDDITETYYVAQCITTVVIIGSILSYFIDVGYPTLLQYYRINSMSTKTQIL